MWFTYFHFFQLHQLLRGLISSLRHALRLLTMFINAYELKQILIFHNSIMLMTQDRNSRYEQ